MSQPAFITALKRGHYLLVVSEQLPGAERRNSVGPGSQKRKQASPALVTGPPGPRDTQPGFPPTSAPAPGNTSHQAGTQEQPGCGLGDAR